VSIVITREGPLEAGLPAGMQVPVHFPVDPSNRMVGFADDILSQTADWSIAGCVGERLLLSVYQDMDNVLLDRNLQYIGE
jgi:hypothetical protein